MTFNRLGKRQAYIYQHLTHEQSVKLDNLRESIVQFETTYLGYFLLTKSEYYLLLPLLNPLVIKENHRRLKSLCQVASVSKENSRKMMRNLWLQSCVGFIPIANIVFTRKFKCNMRNLKILELQMQEEEDRIVFQNANSSKEDVLPKHIAKMFNRCPVYTRPRPTPETSAVSSPVVSVYHSPCTSLSELLVSNPDMAESIRSSQSTAISTATTAIDSTELQPPGGITEKQISMLHSRVSKIKGI